MTSRPKQLRNTTTNNSITLTATTTVTTRGGVVFEDYHRISDPELATWSQTTDLLDKKRNAILHIASL